MINKKLNSDSKLSKLIKSSDESLNALLPNFLVNDIEANDEEDYFTFKEIVDEPISQVSTCFESVQKHSSMDFFKPFCFETVKIF